MKQYKNLSPQTACMFFSVDEENGKILCMTCVPQVATTTNYFHLMYSNYLLARFMC